MDSFKTGEFIKTLRTEKGFTQKELSIILNCTDKAISRWETGKGFPTIQHVITIAKTFNVSSDYILGISDF